METQNTPKTPFSAGAFLGWLGAQLSVSLSLRKFD